MKKLAPALAAAAFLLATPASAAGPSKPGAARSAKLPTVTLVVGSPAAPSKPGAAPVRRAADGPTTLVLGGPAKPSKPSARLIAAAR